MTVGNLCCGCWRAGKIKSTLLLEVLSAKTRDWTARHHDVSPCSDDKLDGRGLFVFKHRERQCFQLVARADNVFVRCAELLKAAFDGSASDPLSALLVISLASDWDFYFLPVQPSGQSSGITVHRSSRASLSCTHHYIRLECYVFAFVCLSVCLSTWYLTKNCSRVLIKFLEVGCATNNS